MRRRSLLIASLVAVCRGWQPRSIEAAESDAEKTLRAAGLHRRTDNAWLLPAEPPLRDRLARLSSLRDAIVVLERELGDHVEQNRQAFEAAKFKLAALKLSLASLPTDDPNRKKIQRQIAAEERVATPPEKLAGRSDVRRLIVELVQTRTTATIALLDARRIIPELQKRYRQLSQNKEITAALEQLGTGHRLGPLRPLGPELRKLAELEPLLLTSHVPIWLQSGKVRFTIIANERQPITLTWNEYPERGFVLTAGGAQTLDVKPADGAEAKTIDFGNGRKLAARRALLKSLRFGRWVATDLTVWVLPAEGEDLGSQIDASALDDYSARCEPAALRLTLQPRGE